MSSRLDFDERRARALEGVVQYRPGAVPPLQPPTGASEDRAGSESEQAERRSRRRRRRRRRPDDARGPRPYQGSDAQPGQTGDRDTSPGAGHPGESLPSDRADDFSEDDSARADSLQMQDRGAAPDDDAGSSES
jgi:hypothetical protein